jgi:UV DNA damage endonuclease
MHRIGYCCISNAINDNKKKSEYIQVNRGLTKKTFNEKGLNYVSELIQLNLSNLLEILKWNIENKIYVYRMSSSMFPMMGFYEIEELPNFKNISDKLVEIGKYIKTNNIRTSFHPDHFCVLASQNPVVVETTIDELNKHAKIMDLMNLEISYQYPINIHVNTIKPSKLETAERFCNNFNLLSDSCKKRLVVENDDGKNQWTVSDLYDLIHKRINIPITIDSLHHSCNPGDLSWEMAFKLAISTWKNIVPIVHHSSSRKIYEDNCSKLTAHADYIYEKFENFNLDVDIEFECKEKDKAVFKYLKEFK